MDDVEEHNQYVVLDLTFQLDDYPIHRYEFLRIKTKSLKINSINLPSLSSACSSSNFVSAFIDCASNDGAGVAGLLEVKFLQFKIFNLFLSCSYVYDVTKSVIDIIVFLNESIIFCFKSVAFDNPSINSK